MQVVIYSKVLHEKDIPYIQVLFDALHQEKVNTYIYAPYLEQLEGKIIFKKDIAVFENHLDFKTHRFDFVITLGGDGTILDAITLVRDSDVPIMGINLGRLGFLASIGKTRIQQSVTALVQGMYSIESRKLLYLESNIPIFGDNRFALNDCTLLKRDSSSMITIHAFINGAYLNSYWADGLIVATPTGSTGYSLSCGGPIIFPDSDNFVITPVAPHNLNVRPIVISDSSVISFEIEGRAENFLCTLDARFETITADYQLAVRTGDFKVRLVQLYDDNFLKTIREKLAWGMDARNH
jgi:NAD+ kinase